MASRHPEPVLTTPFVLAWVSHFFQCLAINLFLHLPGFLHGLGATEVRIGWIVSVMAATAIASRPMMGRAMDRWGRRRMILLGSAVHVVTCALYLTVDSIGPWIFALRAIHGLSEAILFTGLFTLAADLVPASRRTEGLAIFGVSGLLPIAGGGLVGDALLGVAGYRELFLLAAGLAALALLLALPLREGPGLAEGAEPPRGFVEATLQRNLLPLWFIGVVFALSIAPVFVFLKTYVMTTGTGSVGRFLTFYSLAAVFVRLAFGWVPDRVGPRRALVPALITLSVGLAILSRATTPMAMALSGVLAGLGHGFSFPIIAGMVVARARPSERGVAISVFTAVFDVGVLVGGPFFGALIESAGYPAMYMAAAAMAVVGLFVFLAWDGVASTPSG